MKKALVPFNISLLIPTNQQLKMLGQVTSHEIFEGLGGNFHENGLFSVETFGRIGSAEREGRFGYIKLGLPVIHPVVYRNILKLKAFYEDIILGKAYAIFDKSVNDFIKSNELDGKTGYTFFFDNWRKVDFQDTGSGIRKNRLQLIAKYLNNCILENFVVCPAAYREVEIDAYGRVTLDEVNEHYRALLNQTYGIPDYFGPNDDKAIYDRKRVAIQNNIQAIYDHFEKLLSGKGGFIQANWASRKVFNGTRNVISSLDTNAADLDRPNRPGFKDVAIGLLQGSVAVKPKTIFHLRNSIIAEIFDSNTNRVQLLDKKTLKRVWVDVPTAIIDKWGTPDGLEKVINDLRVVEQRGRPIEIEGHYIGLVYLDNDENFKVFRDIEELPDNLNPKFVRPISYAELIYLSGLSMWNTNVGIVTRYPIENYNSSIPCRMYLKTTVIGELRYQLNHLWERDESLPVALEYPIIGKDYVAQWHDSLSLPPSTLSALGADFDGDTASFVAAYSKEAIAEANKFFGSRLAYLKAGGGEEFSLNIHTLNLTLRFMTGEPRPRA
ncbi:putative RNA polymerase beta subunit [Pseudomonas phage Phabio]|uniref:Putative RNA polymerase beta subunit n=1 Tax=Pseudomonas phage Phabio TaxID=2006668 RepID=A0A1Y0SWM4_9CAUD|nr:RNA polymerase beta subunit [Pseudomonas phage Phabio]ARV76895.1 putative RNA polymerase beta subunit [Pseudomonas phage Phabio]